MDVRHGMPSDLELGCAKETGAIDILVRLSIVSPTQMGNAPKWPSSNPKLRSITCTCLRTMLQSS